MPYKTRRDYQAYLARIRERYATDPEYRAKRLKNARRVYKPELKHANHLRRTYNLEPADYQRMLDSHNGCCWICGSLPVPTARFKRLQVDHDHKTNRVRGLLCFRCNTHIAWLENRRESIEEYLHED